jgi:hypothetical protein
MRVKKAVPAIDMGTTAAGIPITVPVSHAVNGMIAAMSTRKGSERPTLMIQFNTT